MRAAGPAITVISPLRQMKWMNVYTMVVTFYFVKQLNTETGNGNGG